MFLSCNFSVDPLLHTFQVDMLIQCFCDDTGVKPQQVAEAIKKDESISNSDKKTNVEWSLLEPVIAANDFNLFVHMMMRKNIELQLQAVQMIEVILSDL